MSVSFSEDAAWFFSKVNGEWKTYQTLYNMPFEAGEPFIVAITCQLYSFEIAVNGTHFATFKHVLPIPEFVGIRVSRRVNHVDKIQYF